MKSGYRQALDPTLRCPDALEFEDSLRTRVVGQEDAVLRTTEVIQKYISGFTAPRRPIANMLFLGPTGTGKTRLVESIAEIFWDDPQSLIKINCAEYQASHDISKIVGSPPGYVGHNDRNTKPVIDQEKLDRNKIEGGKKLCLLLFDEIEKASDALWNLLLGITDRGVMTTGSGNVLNFENTIIFMTSNLGALQMSKEVTGYIGFDTPVSLTKNDLDDKMDRVAKDAARKRFSPEFMNRIDHSIVFHTLKQEQLRQIVRIEMNHVQKRILQNENHIKFSLNYENSLVDFLIEKGTDLRYGARQLKRVIETEVVSPLSNLVLSGQVEFGDLVLLSHNDGKVQFEKIPAEVVLSMPYDEWADFKPAFRIT
jgi:ATP-dependent Clp protease ATP-binding subunit ClpB